MLRVLKNDSDRYLVGMQNNFVLTEGNKYDFITKNIYDDINNRLIFHERLFRNLLPNEGARKVHIGDEIMPLTIKDYYFMSSCLLDSEMLYDKRINRLIDTMFRK